MEAALGIITILVNRRDMKYFSEKKKKKGSNSWGEILLINDVNALRLQDCFKWDPNLEVLIVCNTREQ